MPLSAERYKFYSHHDYRVPTSSITNHAHRN
jgi:hypothetical protein